jgi:hypothetical protein
VAGCGRSQRGDDSCVGKMQMAGNLKAQVPYLASDQQEKVGVVRDWRAPKNSTAGATNARE